MLDVIPYLSLAEASQQIFEHRLSPRDCVEACLARVDRLNPKLNAVITVLPEQARAAAITAESELKAGCRRGALHGIPIGVKDFYDTAGVKTTAAFERFAHRTPARDAAAVATLRNAGAIVIAKTNMHTLGMGTTGLDSFFGPVKNPWNDGYIPGGSSSGSAAAVATGMCYGTLDTDAIGSCRLPAACCGVVGFKATYGLVDIAGILAGETPPDETIRWLSHAGTTTRRVEDAAIVLDVLASHRTATDARLRDGLDVPKQFRVGIATNIRVDAEVAAAFRRAVDTIAGLGHTMTEAVVPFAGPERGTGQIEHDRASIARVAFADVDLLLLPTTPTVVPRVVNAVGKPQALSAAHTAFANYYGIPAISVPCGFDSNGLPLALQIVGRPRADIDVLRLAHQFEVAARWFDSHPATSS